MSKISDLHEALVVLEVTPISKSCHYSSQDKVNILKTVNEFNRPLANEMAENPSEEEAAQLNLIASATRYGVLAGLTSDPKEDL